MSLPAIYFIYGLSVMFYFMMGWFFIRKNREMLSRLVAALMILIGMQCLGKLAFIPGDMDADNFKWMFISTTDMTAVPFYAFVLIELCRPGTLSLRKMAVHEIPFLLLPILYLFTRLSIFYYADVIWAGIYGTGYAVWTVVAIPRYHRLLKQRFSYTENINLNWLRIILFSFFVILSLWIAGCLIINIDIEGVYMLGSLVIWMFICYFIYRHESVINELSEPVNPALAGNAEDPEASVDGVDDLTERIMTLFENERIFLNPQLKLSDVAAMANSNRTYVSRFFNTGHGKTFFEFVNDYRVRYAKQLLQSTSERIEVIAEQSGFSSRQSFHRVFSKFAGCTPEQYRKEPTC